MRQGQWSCEQNILTSTMEEPDGDVWALDRSFYETLDRQLPR